VQDQPPGVEGHRQALARALRVPDHADPLVSRLAAGAVSREVGAGRLLGFWREVGGPQRLLDRDIDRVELVIPRDLLRERATAEILEDNEMRTRLRNRRGWNTPASTTCNSGRPGAASSRPLIVRQGLNHSLPAPSAPTRACTPPEAIRTALYVNSAGIRVW